MGWELDQNWASENFDGFIASDPSSSPEFTAENLSPKRSSFLGSEQNLIGVFHDQIGELTDHPATGDRRAHDRNQTLARHVIESVKHHTTLHTGELAGYGVR